MAEEGHRTSPSAGSWSPSTVTLEELSTTKINFSRVSSSGFYNSLVHLGGTRAQNVLQGFELASPSVLSHIAFEDLKLTTSKYFTTKQSTKFLHEETELCISIASSLQPPPTNFLFLAQITHFLSCGRGRIRWNRMEQHVSHCRCGITPL